MIGIISNLSFKITTMTITSKIALGILGALAAGLAIGVLIAPEKGAETRKRVKRKAGRWVDSMGNLFHKSQDGVQSGIEKIKRKQARYQGEAL
jgi:gas vesicle protein